jgi:4-hydroxybenzoate polyprenyltransferase
MVAGVGLGSLISRPFMYTAFVLWVMGCIYNIRPVRSKDLPYLDVLSEAVNNPIRMLAGWFIAGTASVAPASLLLSYWMVGCYFMAMKRYAEFRDIADQPRAAAYRKSFAFYSEERLLVTIAFPLVSLVMAIYLMIAFRKDSAVQRPEGLYKEPILMAAVVTCAIVITVALLVDMPILQQVFNPTAPTIGQRR